MIMKLEILFKRVGLKETDKFVCFLLETKVYNALIKPTTRIFILMGIKVNSEIRKLILDLHVNI